MERHFVKSSHSKVKVILASTIVLVLIIFLIRSKVFEEMFLKSYIAEIRINTKHPTLKEISILKESQLGGLNYQYGRWIRNKWIRSNEYTILNHLFKLKGISDPEEISFVLINYLWKDLQINKLKADENLSKCDPDSWKVSRFHYSATSSHLFTPMAVLFGAEARDFIEKIESADTASYINQMTTVFAIFSMNFKNKNDADQVYNLLDKKFSMSKFVHIVASKNNVSITEGNDITFDCFNTLKSISIEKSKEFDDEN